MSPELYSFLFKIGFISVFFTGALVIFNAYLSAREIGGSLGQGLKKVAAGTIAQTIIILTFLLLERGNRGFLTDEQVRAFFIITGLSGSVLLILGYVQIYRIAKKLRLFTP